MSPTGDGFFLARLERTATCTARSTNHPRRAKLLGIARSRVRRNIFACSSFSAFLFTLQSEICGFPSGATLFFRRFRRVIRRIFASACASLLSLSLSLSLSLKDSRNMDVVEFFRCQQRRPKILASRPVSRLSPN